MSASDIFALGNIALCLAAIVLRNAARKAAICTGSSAALLFLAYNVLVPRGSNIRVDLLLTIPLTLLTVICTVLCIKNLNNPKKL